MKSGEAALDNVIRAIGETDESVNYHWSACTGGVGWGWAWGDTHKGPIREGHLSGGLSSSEKTSK